jgi:hypothetical protein
MSPNTTPSEANPSAAMLPGCLALHSCIKAPGGHGSPDRRSRQTPPFAISMSNRAARVAAFSLEVHNNFARLCRQHYFTRHGNESDTINQMSCPGGEVESCHRPSHCLARNRFITGDSWPAADRPAWRPLQQASAAAMGGCCWASMRGRGRLAAQGRRCPIGRSDNRLGARRDRYGCGPHGSRPHLGRVRS